MIRGCLAAGVAAETSRGRVMASIAPLLAKRSRRDRDMGEALAEDRKPILTQKS
jgi:hypothetical protein